MIFRKRFRNEKDSRYYWLGFVRRTKRITIGNPVLTKTNPLNGGFSVFITLLVCVAHRFHAVVVGAKAGLLAAHHFDFGRCQVTDVCHYFFVGFQSRVLAEFA
jgi:hypothetical protein